MFMHKHVSKFTAHLKPIFHCEVKTLALGPLVGFDTQHEILRWEYQHAGILKCLDLLYIRYHQ